MSLIEESYHPRLKDVLDGGITGSGIDEIISHIKDVVGLASLNSSMVYPLSSWRCGILANCVGDHAFKDYISPKKVTPQKVAESMLYENIFTWDAIVTVIENKLFEIFGTTGDDLRNVLRELRESCSGGCKEGENGLLKSYANEGMTPQHLIIIERFIAEGE